MFGGNCAVYPCVKSYKASVQNFVLEEEEVASVPLANGSKTFNFTITSMLRVLRM